MKRFVGLLMVCVLLFGTMVAVAQELPPGIPRDKTLIIQFLFAPMPVPGHFNLWAGWRAPNMGLHQFATEALWTLNPNVVEGGIINGLAETGPIYNEDFTKLTIKLRKGIYWSDGVEFTADDLVYTIELAKKTPGFAYHGQMQEVKKVYAADRYTVVVELEKPNTRFHTAFLERWNALRPVPKHIFEKVSDPMAFDFNPPISIGTYVYAAHDPAGYWVLWKKRADWQRTVAGKLFGEPVPEYVLFISYGPPEKTIMAMLNNQLDVAQGTAEMMHTLLSRSKTTRSYRATWPYIDPRDISTRGPSFNHLKYPYNIKDVRWALALAIDPVETVIMAYDGMAALTPGLPLVVSQTFYEWYFKKLEPWLENLTLDLGGGKTFKPWDPTVPFKVLEWAKKQYKVDLDPKNVDAVRMALGYGWWKYSPEAAEALLKKHGFSRGPDGKWRLPDGKPWKVTILSGTDVTAMDYIVCTAIIEQWKKFGIDAEFFMTPAAGQLGWVGDFEVGSVSHGQWAGEPWGLHPDLYMCFNSMRSSFVKPVGEPTMGWNGRWSDPRMDKIIEELEKTPWDDIQRIVELGLEGLKLEIEEMIAIPIINCPIAIVFNEYYWTNFTSPDNDYARSDVFTTWPELKYIMHKMKPTGRK